MVYNCTIEKDGDMFIAQFPDMPNIVTGGFSHEEALTLAKDALDGCLEVDVSHGREIPPPAFAGGYPVRVSPHIAVAMQFRALRGNQSQSDVASRLGLSYQSYQRLENPRKSNPTVKTLERIASSLGKELAVELR
jgi:antitoxin HicB